MSDLTVLFKKYIHIIEGDREKTVNKVNVNRHNDLLADEYSLKDTFIKECHGLLKLILELRKVLRSIENEYLSETDMTESEKDDFDTELRLQLHQYVQKFRLLQNYEEKRQELITKKFISGRTSVTKILQGSSKSEKLMLFHRTNNDFRLNVLNSLSMWLNMASSQFASMQQQRLYTQRKFDNLDFNSGLHLQADLQDVANVSSVSQSRVLENTQDEVRRYEETVSKLTQEQLQLLKDEHEELLNQKNEQLKKVEKINKTIMDIVSIQNEISANLQVQSQNINNVLDHQDDIEINIREGNKQLTKAKRAAGRTAKMTTYTAIILAVLILFLDYIG